MEDSSTESSVGSGGPAREVSERNSISNWAREYFCDTLANNVVLSAFVLKICLRQTEKQQINRGNRFQDSLILALLHGY